MDAQTIKQTTNLITLAERAGAQFHKAGRVWQSACPLHQGDNPTAFTVFVGKDGIQHFKCFTRNECNQHGSDVIAFVQARDGVDFKTALQTLGGELRYGSSAVPAPMPVHKPAITLPDSTWQRETWRDVGINSDRLLCHADGQPAREYLTRRGLLPETWHAHNIGAAHIYDPKVKRRRLAISLPWWDTEGGADVVTAVKYRFIGEDPAGLRYTARPGSVFVLYGLAYALESNLTLCLVEGELNALSIWQCQLSGVSVVSIGSEGGGRPEVLRALFARYRHVLTWLDDPERARALSALSGPAAMSLLQSPQLDGVKWDANRMLQAGYLFDFLGQKLNAPKKKV
jgi:hypothetical protein